MNKEFVYQVGNNKKVILWCIPSLAVAQDSHLQRVTIPEAAYVQFASLTSWW